jgi:hypothetical protein
MTSAPPDQRPSPRNPALKVFLILDSLFTLVAAPLALFWGVMSVMASTTTTNTGWADIYALVNLTLPVAMVLCLGGGWLAFALRRERVAWVVMFLPILWLVVSIAMMAAWPKT